MQIDRLRKEILKNIGFRNVFYSKGFEADDLIASCCQNLRSQDQAIVVSADHDMLQLLSNVVSIYVPTKKQHVTRKSFKRDYGVSPKQWITVKCLAGCSTDEVPGIRGVGEKTAIKYLRGELKPTSAAHHKIKAGIANGIIETNKRLVKLPFENTPDCFLKPDKKLEWGPVLKELNIKSLNTGDDAMPPFNG